MQLNPFYTNRIVGAVHGLDRVRFRGTLRLLANERGLNAYLAWAGILLKDFGAWVAAKTEQLRASCAARARDLGVELLYLRSSAVDKEALARRIAQEKAIRHGSIALLSVVETCTAPAVAGNRATQQLELQFRPRKCVWIYHYWDDPTVGFGHVRLQTWLPFTVHVCLNGRHWLEKQLQQQNLAYLKDGNCFPWLADCGRAQTLLDQQLRTDWPPLLDRLVAQTCPVLAQVLAPLRWQYYWSAEETEYATDLLFRRAADVQALYPQLLWQAVRVSDAPAVLRYLGKGQLSAHGRPMGKVPAEILSDYRRRHEGVRVKHWINHNSVKLYSKAGTVLRAETTINDTRQFKVFRRPEDDRTRAPAWLPLRKGVSDLQRRCVVSQRANERYLEALAATAVGETLQQTVATACQPCRKHGRRYRALAPWRADDQRVLEFLAKGEHALNGFRNADLRGWLYGDTARLCPRERQRRSARCTRRLALLRAHGLIRKVPNSNRYVLTAAGQKFCQALLTASATRTEDLMKLAA